MSSFLPPKIGCNFSSARISRLFFGFWSLFFLMCAQIFFVTSLRGSGWEPTIFARCSEGCMGFMKALFAFVLPAAFAIDSSILKLRLNHWNCNEGALGLDPRLGTVYRVLFSACLYSGCQR